MHNAPRHMKRILPALGLAAMVSVSLSVTSALAETFTVTDIASPDGDMQVIVPTLEVVDGNLTEAQIRSLFEGDIASVADALAGLEATAIRIPELRLTFLVPDTAAKTSTGGKLDKGATAPAASEPQTAEFVYKDLVIENIENGVAGAIKVGSGELVSTEDVSFTLNEMSAADFNIAATLGFYGLVPSASDEIVPIYKDFTFGGGAVVGDDVSCDIGSATASEFRARPLRTPLLDIVRIAEELEALEDDETPPPEVIHTFIDFYVDMLTAFETTPMTFTGVDCTGVDDSGNDVKVATGPIEIGAFGGGVYPSISMSDFDVNVQGDGFVKLGNFTMKPIDLNPLIELLENAPETVDEAWFEANARQLLPGLEGFSARDFAMDVEDPEDPDQRIKISLGEFDLTLADYVNGIPTNVNSITRDLSITLPESAGAEMGLDLDALGLRTLVMGYDVVAHWNEAEDLIVIENLGVDVKNLGTVKLTATIGNAAPELFGNDVDVAAMAAMGLVVKDVILDVTDTGGKALALKQAATEQGVDEKTLATQMAGIAQGTALAMLGGTADAKTVGDALAAFIGGSDKITINMTAKDPAGVGLVEFMALEEDPTQITQVMTITAEASSATQ